MTVRATIRIQADSALLLGGHSAPLGFSDAAGARDADGRPIIPASALRGALREGLVRLLRSRGRDACDPWDSQCQADDPCAVCRIFGRAGTDRPGLVGEGEERGPGVLGVTIGDARLVGDGGAFAVRHGVSVDRKTGHASPGRYYQREVADVAGRVFEAPLHGALSEGDLELLGQAARLVAAMGNSRSRGLGAVTVRVEKGGEKPERPVTVGKKAPDGRVRVTVKALTPLHLGGAPDDGNFRDSDTRVTGSALRGALAWAAVHAGLDGEPGFQALVKEARWSDLWPGEGHTGPAPRTLIACREHGEQAVDAIFAAALQPRILAKGGAPAAPWTCPKCGAPLRPAGGTLVDYDTGRRVRQPPTRVATRLAIDPRTGSFAAGMLHARAEVPSRWTVPTDDGADLYDTRFSGTVAGVDDALRALLQRLPGPVQVGGHRTRGRGEVSLKLEPWDDSALRERLQRFARDVEKARIAALLAWLGLPAGTLVEVVARTPLAAPADLRLSETGDWLARTLFDGRTVEVLGTFARTGRRSGWADRRFEGGGVGPDEVRTVIRPGSTWLLLVVGDDALPPDTLADAEVRGVGDLTELGLGRLVFDPQLSRQPPRAR